MWKNAKWIWLSETPEKDEYVEFFSSFASDGEKTVLRISCDGDYTLWLNGVYVASNQYGDFEHYKIYDELDVTPYLKKGENKVEILVWHYGQASQKYLPGKAGVLFEVESARGVLASSDEGTLCRKNIAYRNGYCKCVSSQLGFTFLYDARKQGVGECRRAVVIDKKCSLFPRPVKKLSVLERAPYTVLEEDEKHILVDLGRETVGLPSIECFSETEQKLTVCWGENLQDGHVRDVIGANNYSYEYLAQKGENNYTNYMLRICGRYLEVYAESPVKFTYVGVLPQNYAVKKKEFHLPDALDQRIYDVCVRTLELCLMEHYVDTPWREQGFYCFDSRNQMLCGYDAFEGGNQEYARANLMLIGQDRRADNLLSICCPCGVDLAIPSFSLYYFTAVEEYVLHTGDCSLARELFPKLTSVLGAFIAMRKDGLVWRFSGEGYWNFYDWSQHMEGDLSGNLPSIPDLMVNCLFIRALESVKNICARIGEEFVYDAMLEEERKRTKEAFFVPEKGLFTMTQGGGEYTVLGNSMAILAGLTDEKEGRLIAKKLVDNSLIECSLSMKTFQYDALLKVDYEAYRDVVLGEIRANYKIMLDAGATSVWETVEGAAAFGGSGSLCHGWSAVPVHYYHLFFKEKNN